LDTTLGDALFTLDPGKFEGQQVHLIVDGTGIAELIGGNGIYVNSIFITENTGGTHLKWTNSKWVAVNEVTADYVAGSWSIKKCSSGNVSAQGLNDSNVTSLTAVGNIARGTAIFTHPLTILNRGKVSPMTVKTITGTSANWGGDIITESTTETQIRALASSSLVTLECRIAIEGNY
jgi:hypothetical protein